MFYFGEKQITISPQRIQGEYKLERLKSYLFQGLQEHKMTHLLSILVTMSKPRA